MFGDYSFCREEPGELTRAVCSARDGASSFNVVFHERKPRSPPRRAPVRRAGASSIASLPWRHPVAAPASSRARPRRREAGRDVALALRRTRTRGTTDEEEGGGGRRRRRVARPPAGKGRGGATRVRPSGGGGGDGRARSPPRRWTLDRRVTRGTGRRGTDGRIDGRGDGRGCVHGRRSPGQGWSRRSRRCGPRPSPRRPWAGAVAVAALNGRRGRRAGPRRLRRPQPLGLDPCQVLCRRGRDRRGQDLGCSGHALAAATEVSAAAAEALGAC